MNLLLAGWLVISGFAWEHSAAQRTNAVVVGYLCFLATLLATSVSTARRVNSVLAVWLLLSTLLLPHARLGTLVNGALVAIAIFLLSLVPRWTRPAGALWETPAPGARAGSSQSAHGSTRLSG